MNNLSHIAALAFLLLPPMTGLGETRAFRVTTDKTIDSSSLENIVRGAIEQSGARTNDEKAIAIYEYLHNTIFHWAYPTESAPQSVGPLKVINVYGWGLCGGQHTVLKALYETAGWQCRYVGWSNPGHTTVEVFYDNRWHYFDVFLKCYFWSKDKSHVVGQEEIAADPSLVLNAVKEGRAARQHLCCGDEPAGIISGVKSRKVAGDQKGWASVTWRDQDYSPLLRLPSGASLRLDWGAEPGGFAINGKAPRHSCGNKDVRSDSVLGPIAEHYGTRDWSNGRLSYQPDFAKAADVADIELTGAAARDGKLVSSGGAGTAIFKLPLPYAYVATTATAAFEGGEGKLFISTDAGKTWKPCPQSAADTQVKQKYQVWLKAEFSGALSRLRFDALVEHNRYALPYLKPGRNTITVSAEPAPLPANASLVVTYCYQEASAPDPVKRTRWDGKGVQYSAPKTMTREIATLPFTFDIEAAGNTPPKMLYLERAVKSK